MDIKEGAMPGQNRLAFKKRQSLPNDQEVTFPELEPMFVELDEVVKRFGTLPGWGGGDQARWSSISGFPEQVYRFTPPRPHMHTANPCAELHVVMYLCNRHHHFTSQTLPCTRAASCIAKIVQSEGLDRWRPG